MQVGLSHSSLSLTSPASSGGVNNLSAVRGVAASRARQPDKRFPESPLISTRPLRYNVQLNQQLTSVQQADSYLSQVEGALLQLRYAGQNSRRSELMGETTTALQQLLDNRQTISNGTIDRHLRVQLETPVQVQFMLPAAQRLVQSDEGETLLFSLAGPRREMFAVALETGSSPQQQVLRLNQGLGRFGVHVSMDEQQQLSFCVEEKEWARVASQLSVRGEGKRFAASFTALLARPEPAISDTLNQLAQQPQRVRELQNEVQQALEQLTQQRGYLQAQQTNVRKRIDEMDFHYQTNDATQHAQALNQHLQSSSGDYFRVARAIGAQANLQPATVKNLLG